MTDATRLSIGANNPPVAELLSEQYKDMVADLETWIGAGNRAPETITSDDMLAKVGLVIAKLNTICSDADKAHTVEKKPYLDGGRAVDKFYSDIQARAREKAATLVARQKPYLEKKNRERIEAEQKREAQARAETEAKLKQAAEAEQRGDEAGAAKALESAAQADADAAQAAKLQTGKSADRVRTYGGGGNVVSTRTEWTFEVVDRDKLPDHIKNHPKVLAALHEAQDKVIGALVKSGERSIIGVTIKETLKPVNK